MIQTKTESFVLQSLPYAHNALEPYISGRTLYVHHGKHHQAYVNKLNELVSGTEFAELSLEEILIKTSGDFKNEALFNNAAQVWNHDFYWNSLSPKGGGKPSGALGQALEVNFGSYENFIVEFAKAGVAQFGSGWVWLVNVDGILKITQTSNAENPMSKNQGTALLALDLWEHAYYLDFQNRRNDYLGTLLDKLIHWDFASENFGI